MNLAHDPSGRTDDARVDSAGSPRYSERELEHGRLATLLAYVTGLVGTDQLRDPSLWSNSNVDRVPRGLLRRLGMRMMEEAGASPANPASCAVVATDDDFAGVAAGRERKHSRPAPRRTWLAWIGRWIKRLVIGTALLVSAALLLLVGVVLLKVSPQLNVAIDQGVREARIEQQATLAATPLVPASANVPSGGYPLDPRGIPYDPGTYPNRTTGEVLSAMEQRVVVDVVGARGIALKSLATEDAAPAKRIPFVVFSDPGCPNCRQFEQTLRTLSSRYLPVVVPVAFLPDSEEVVARVLCSSDREAAWKRATEGLAVEAPACEAGRAGVLQGNGAFIALRFTKTPTYVGPAGNVAAGAASAADLTGWLDASAAKAAEDEKR